MTTTRTLPPGLRLDRGAHDPPNGEFAACIVEAAAWVAGEPWSDHPECVCPVIGAFCREWNDGMDDEDRQMLLPYVTRIVGTNHGPEVAEQRAWMATDWLVRECAPAWLRLAGLDEHAHTLECLAALDSTERAREAQPSVDAAWAAAWDAAGAAAGAAAWDAARAAAWDAARAAARAAAGAAARAAAGAAARAAARAAWDAAWAAAGAAARAAAGAAGAAAGDAAGDAAWAAAGAAARAAWDAAWAAGERLDPTKRALQQSALRLLDSMVVRP